MSAARPSYIGPMVAMALTATASSIIAAWYFRKQLESKKAKMRICKKPAVQSTTPIASIEEERPNVQACNSTTSTEESAATLYPNPFFQPDKFRLCYEQWKKVVGQDTLNNKGITEESLRWTCHLICARFPRGSHCGALLWDPVMDDTPLEQRGVSMQWLQSVYAWMQPVLQSKEGCNLPTRLFVALFVEPLILQSTATLEQQQPIPLYYFVPIQFRGKPQVFLSHAWDSWLRQLLYWDSTSLPGRLAKKRGLSNTFLWLDAFAVVQDAGSDKQQKEVAQIGRVVRSIGQTCLVLPGHGTIHFALLPARRSWCCLEIAYSQNLSARVDITHHQLQQPPHHNTSFHQSLIDEISQLKCSDAETSNDNEKKAIQGLLDQDFGLGRVDHLVQRSILKAFYEQYSRAAIYGSPCPITILYCQALGKIQ